MTKKYKVKAVKNEFDKYTYIYEIYYKGEKVFEWHDNAHIDYPEDLSWNRMISDVFDSGVKLGMRINKEE